MIEYLIYQILFIFITIKKQGGGWPDYFEKLSYRGMNDAKITEKGTAPFSNFEHEVNQTSSVLQQIRFGSILPVLMIPSYLKSRHFK